MTKLTAYVQAHPEQTAFMFAAFAAIGAWQAFRGGMQAQRIRTATDFIKSNEMGG